MTVKRYFFSAILSSALVLSACGTGEEIANKSVKDTPRVGEQAQPSPSVTTATTVADLPESRSKSDRLAVSYDGGVMVIDGGNLKQEMAPEVLDTFDAKGYLRLNRAGDGRHVFVSTDSSFKALDLGAYERPHGDHSHYYAGDPSFTGFEVSAVKPGHVVGNADKAVLFDDETGDVTTLRLQGMDMVDHFHVPAHHGIAVLGEDGTYMVTIADQEGDRIGVAQVDAEGKELKRFEHCPGAHGAAETSAGVFVGCADGGLVYRDGEVTKVKSPDPYGRIGNQASRPDSKYVLGDYKSDKVAADKDELERPTQVSIIDAESGEMQLVDLGASYTFRSLAMTDDNTAVVLGTDGKVHLIDAEKAEVIRSIDVLAPWEESEEWQDPRPAITVIGSTAYVTDPARNEIHAIDLDGNEKPQVTKLPEQPDELEAA
ncbi:hypothetical protein [Corynebacterium sp. H113]|uniref:hypothetical protein n=1 Tax=Corynebacterium sp. H113 TaxID=3133419 RepID=UPI003096BA86